MLDLAADPRTSQVYADASVRHIADRLVGIPERTGPAVDLLLSTLAPSETAQWLSWAYELKGGPATWWMVVLTRKRLVGVSPNVPTQVWESGAGSWSTTSLGGDVVLHLPAGAPLRVRGSGESMRLFDAKGGILPTSALHRDEPMRRESGRRSRPPAEGISVTDGATATGLESVADPADPPELAGPANGPGATRQTRRQARRAAGPRPRRPRKRRVRRQRVGFAPPPTIWDMADNCVKCGRPLTDPRSRQARVGTKCIRIYGSQQRRIPNPQYSAWIDRKTKADVAYVTEKVQADAEYARAKTAYDEALAKWKLVRARR